MISTALLGPQLDRSGEPWIGTFPGLGTVRVHADGSYVVDVAPAGDAGARDALEFGWAEPLSMTRRGLRLAHATTLLSPGADAYPDPPGALMLSGRQQAVAEVAVCLADHGWRLIAHGFTPVETSGSLIAHPRRAPWVAPRHLIVSSPLADDTRVRPDATLQFVRGARHDQPAMVHGRLSITVDDTPRADESAVIPIRGSHRMSADHQVLSPMQAGRDVPAAQIMREEVLLASIPLGRLRWPTLAAPTGAEVETTLVQVLAWWREVSP